MAATRLVVILCVAPCLATFLYKKSGPEDHTGGLGKVKPEPEDPPAVLGKVKSGPEDHRAGLGTVKPGPEDLPAVLGKVKTGPEDSIAVLDKVKSESEAIAAVLGNIKPRSEDPTVLEKVKPGSKAPPGVLGKVKPVPEDPTVVLGKVKTGPEDSTAVLDKVKSEPETIAVLLGNIKPRSEDPTILEKVKPGSEAPAAVRGKVKPGHEDLTDMLGTVKPGPEDHAATVLDNVWDDFKNTFKKTYNKRLEPLKRLAWEENLLKVHLHNEEAKNGLHNYTLRENHLADMTVNDYVREMVRLTRSRHRRCDTSDILMAASPDAIPEEIDWRKMGFVLPEMNQDKCGACYAFSVGTLVQAQIFKNTGKWIPLSEQQIVDCSVLTGNLGCLGGSLRNTMRYVLQSGLTTYDKYPYTSKQSVCRYSTENSVVNITDWRVLPPRDEDLLKVALATIGPIAVSINASPHTFMLYHSGVYHDPDCSSDKVNHAMLLIGYTKDAWILKNWWSEHWGQEGYMYLVRGSNLCGVANFALYALI